MFDSYDQVPKDANGMPSKFIELMKRCWDQDPSKRPHFVDIVAMMNVMYNENESRDRKLRKTFGSSSSHSQDSRNSSKSSVSSSSPSSRKFVFRKRRGSSKKHVKADSIAVAIASPSRTKSCTSTVSSTEVEMSSSHSPSSFRFIQ